MSYTTGNHCSFVLLAEFNIHEGASLRYQFPQPLGVNEAVLAMSMLPDGAETQLDDWTVFFLNQTSWNTIQPVLPMDTPEAKLAPLPGDEVNPEEGKELLCVLNLVRTRHDKSLQRGAQVLALAICTRHPFIQIFKPILLMALGDYLAAPAQGQEVLSRLFDSINSMDLSGAPVLTRAEKLVMRGSDRKDVFAEKFMLPEKEKDQNPTYLKPETRGHKSKESWSSLNSFDEGIMMRTGGLPSSQPPEREKDWDATIRAQHPEPSSYSSSSSHSYLTSAKTESTAFSLGGSAVWVGDDSSATMASSDDNSSLEDLSSIQSAVPSSGTRQRSSTDASSTTASSAQTRVGANPMALGGVRDTHFYNTTVRYKDHALPIKMPLANFREEVGDYSFIPLLKLFTNPTNGPTHPHIHTNGPQTHPIIVLFNALVTGKRILFLGHKRPAGEVSNVVLSACALGSGCGAVLRGFIERAFPYANLENRDEWEGVPAYIAGVTNPIFTAFKTWDLLLDIGTGVVTVASEIHQTYPYVSPPSLTSLSRSGTFRGDLSSSVNSAPKGSAAGAPSGVGEKVKEGETVDAAFIDDLKLAVDNHYGESPIRLRIQEYVWRFLRIASRYEEEVYGITKIGWPSKNFNPLVASGGQGAENALGSGFMFLDEGSRVRELSGNAARIEAWRKTNSYEYCIVDHQKHLASATLKGFDPQHQLFRLRHAKMTDAEAMLIMRTFREKVKGYDAVVDLLMHVVPQGGLMHLAFGLFHPKEAVRDATVDLFNSIRQHHVGTIFLQALNHFQRYAYVRQAYERENRKRRSYQPSPNLQPNRDPNLPAIPAIHVPMTRTHSDSVSFQPGTQASFSTGPDRGGLAPAVELPRRTSESGIAF
ncbi:mesa protein [Flagelloscypha sp. PMI_526]|nr:mesa protein [Flagelloscypha sp. PMI_526]